jgi:hypothetical protein
LLGLGTVDAGTVKFYTEWRHPLLQELEIYPGVRELISRTRSLQLPEMCWPADLEAITLTRMLMAGRIRWGGLE